MRELPPLRLLNVRALGGADEPGRSPEGKPAEPERENAAAPGEKAGAPGEKAGAVLARLMPPELPPKLGPRGEGDALRSWLPAPSTGLPRGSSRLLERAKVDPEPKPLPPPPNVKGRAPTFKPPEPKPPPPPPSRPEPDETRPAVLGRPAAVAPPPKPEPGAGFAV